MNRLVALVVPFVITLAGCSGAAGPSPFVGWFKDYATCREEYLAMDARVAAAGVGDAFYHRVPGYPYLRTDRLTASFAHEVESFDQVGGWLRRMREFDQEAREFEFRNLGMSKREVGIQRSRFQNCSRTLATLELDDAASMEKLKDLAQPADEYSGVARAVGLYPLMVPVLQSRIGAEQEAVKREFAKPLAELDAPGPLTLWRVKPYENPDLGEIDFRKTLLDELGLPGLTESHWQALAALHAPALWVETAGEHDRPGAPRWSDTGVDVDITQPLINYTISFARFGGQSVSQITYFVWFRGNGEASPRIDGMIWRVSLGMDSKVIAYESLHASGRSHYWFPAQALTPRQNDSYWRQPEFIPQGQVTATRLALRLQSGSHALRRVVNADEAQASGQHTYELRRYEDLYTLPLPAGGSRSLFGPDGVVPGSAGSDPTWMWSSGVRAPGALKQYGHQTPAYVGREHFDAPFLLESVFVPPPAPAAPFVAPSPTG